MNCPWRKLLTFALVAHLLAIVAMAAYPHWHEEAHHDADEHEHECAVTIFQSGGTNDTAPAPVLTKVILPCVDTVRMEAAQEVFRARGDGSIRGRAPPVAAV